MMIWYFNVIMICYKIRFQFGNRGSYYLVEDNDEDGEEEKEKKCYFQPVDNSPPSVIGPDPIVLVRTKISNAAKLGQSFYFSHFSLIIFCHNSGNWTASLLHLTQIHSAFHQRSYFGKIHLSIQVNAFENVDKYI